MKTVDKQIYASIQQSLNSLITKLEQKWEKKWDFVNEFLDTIADRDKITSNMKKFENAVAKAEDALALSDNVKFIVAVNNYRDELLGESPDEGFLNLLYKEILSIFHLELAKTRSRYENFEINASEVALDFVSRSSAILEQARLAEMIQDDEDDMGEDS